MDATLNQEPHLATDHHEDATHEEVDGADVEGDEPGEEREADDRMDPIAKEKGKEMARVEDDEEEEEAAEQEVMSSVDGASEHDDSKGGAKDAHEDETKRPDADVEEDEDVGEHDDSERSEQAGAGDKEEEAGKDAVKHAQRVGGKETATPQEGAEAEGSPQLKPASSSGTTVAECADVVAPAQGMPDNSAKGIRPITSHPEAPSKKRHKADGAQHAAPVASPARSALGLNTITGKSKETSRSRSLRSKTDLGTGKQQANKAQPAKLNQTAAQGKAEQPIKRILEEHLNAKKKMIDELASKDDFKGAAAAQEELKDLEALAQQLRAKKTMVAEFAADGDYTAAANAQQEIKAMEDRIMQKVAPKNDFKEAAVAQEVSTGATIERQSRVLLEAELNAKKEIVKELASKHDYEGAAAAQEAVKKIEVQLAATGEQKKIPDEPAEKKDFIGQAVVILEDQLNAKRKMMSELAFNQNYTGAAAAHDEVMKLDAFAKQLHAKKTTVDKLAGQGDYKGAAAAQQEIKTTVEQIMEKFGPKKHIAETAAAEAVAHCLEKQLAAKRKTMDELAAKQDYTGAAAAHAEILKLEEQLSGLGASAKANELLETQIRSKTEKMNELALKGDFAGAAAAQKEVNALTNSRSAIPTAMPPLAIPTPMNRASEIQRDLRGGSNADRTTGRGPPLVSLETLRVLSSSKITQVPARNPRKGAGKKGAGRKGGGKKGSEPAWEDFAAIYLGCIKTKQIHHVLAYGDRVEKLRAYVGLDTQPIVNAENLEKRPGKEELICTSATVIKKCLEPKDSPARFVYDVSDVTKHLATKAYGEQTSLGDFIDLVLHVDTVTEMPIQSGANVGQSYLLVTGVDMNGVEVGPLRLWNHVEGDVEIGKTCIIRGLKVMNERQWNGERYIRDREGAIKFESDARTAIEDVSDQPEITSYF